MTIECLGSVIFLTRKTDATDILEHVLPGLTYHIYIGINADQTISKIKFKVKIIGLISR